MEKPDDEDLALEQRLKLYVERVQDSDHDMQMAGLEGLRSEILSSTSSLFSVRKPLKFLRPFYDTLKAFFVTMTDPDLKKNLADILSVLAMTMSSEGQESLKYKLLGSDGDIGSWGHEYVRNLASEITEECMKRKEENASMDDLTGLVHQIVAFHMQHNAEHDAVDLLTEVEHFDLLVDHCDCSNFKKTCAYLTRSARCLPGPVGLLALDAAYDIYVKFKEYASALVIALFLNDDEHTRVKLVFDSCNNVLMKKQLCYILARHGVILKLDEAMVPDATDRELCQKILGNGKLSEGYLNLARNVEVMEPKSPEDMYKAHLLDGGVYAAGASVVSTWQNLAVTFVNAFVNAGFGQDKLMTNSSDASSGGSSENWLLKNWEHGKTSAAASLDAAEHDVADFGLGSYSMLTLLSCAYAGTGDKDKVNSFFKKCSEDLEEEEIDLQQAVLGIALVAMNDETGIEMPIRLLEKFLTYGKENMYIKRVVPLALGLLCISNPKVNVMDTLSRLSLDTDFEVAMAAVISLGLIGAGTDNTRIAGMLRNISKKLSVDDYKDAGLLFCVRIAQGLLHMGKGLLTLNPYHSHGFLPSPVALAGLIIMLHACLDIESIILGKYSHVLYFLALSMQPQMLMTVDEDLNPLQVSVRVGRAVDTVGLVGRPEKISGGQIHSTPVLLTVGQRAELATEKYIPLSPMLEGFVILRKNPDYEEDH